jgi:hypothetical protein
MPSHSRSVSTRLLRFVSILLNCIWLFFPAILFVLLFIFFFWLLGAGKDIIVAFTENSSSIYGLKYTRIIFFIAIGFWVYVSWYSSRVIAYIKKSKQEETVKAIAGVDDETAEEEFLKDNYFFDISKDLLDEFPRIVGNACFLALELAVLQSTAFVNPMHPLTAVIIFVVALVLLRYLNRWIWNHAAEKPGFRKSFYYLLFITLALILLAAVISHVHILIFFGLLILFHATFIFYIHLRRMDVLKKELSLRSAAVGLAQQTKHSATFLEKIMDYFSVPRKESGYFSWGIYIAVAGFIFYLFAIFWLFFARAIGPFPFIILAFGVLLTFGNIVTAFSIRNRTNFHFILFLIAVLLNPWETHYVKTLEVANGNNYNQRPSLNLYLSTWLHDRNVLADTSRNGYDIYFVMANGGASRSGYWTSAVLGQLEDASVQHNPLDRFSDHVFCLSGTSGGGVGVATFFSLLRDKEAQPKLLYDTSARAFLKKDYFTYTFARMLGPDYFNYIFHVPVADRGRALESSFEITSRHYDTTLFQVPFYDNFSNFPAIKNQQIYLPVLCINTTRMQDGNPGVVTNIRLDSATFNNRIDVVKLLAPDKDISMASAAILGARFPYLSPAGRIGKNYFVDGGYFDNSGAGVVQEIIRGIVNAGKQDSIDHGSTSMLYQQIKKLHFKILHITNSPASDDSANIKKVAPIKNDLFAPILTIVGAYDMQTTVNDGRLDNFIKDINEFSFNKADYTQISLYKETGETKDSTKEQSYAMNWFMSDTTLHRINNRLYHQPKLDSIIKAMYSR